ncbi:CHAT domain-containing protein [Mycena crocata]|nr:CHAT domain-containing protein [Mycena crocata]
MIASPPRIPSVVIIIVHGEAEQFPQVTSRLKISNTSSEPQPDVAGLQHSLGKSFKQAYKDGGTLQDLEYALDALQLSVNLTPEGHPERTDRLNDFAGAMAYRYRRFGQLNDLEAALPTQQQVLELTPAGHPDKASRLQSLGVLLTDRYRRFGDSQDLAESLQKRQEALNLTPEGHPDRADRLRSIAVSLSDRYRRVGDLQDLEAAVQNQQEVLQLLPDGHQARAHDLQSFAVGLLDRYEKLGNMKDLEDALEQNQTAVDMTPLWDPERAGRLQSLAVAFMKRYDSLGDLKDLEQALQRRREALDLAQEEHPERAGHLQDFAQALMLRYRRLGDPEDNEESLRIIQEVVRLTPKQDPYRAVRLKGFSISLQDRYYRLGRKPDLEASVHTLQEAIMLTPGEHPDRPGFLQSLALTLAARYLVSADLADLNLALGYYAESFKTSSSLPYESWRSAFQWAAIAEKFRPSDCLNAYMAGFLSVRHKALQRLNLDNMISTATRTCINLGNLTSAMEIVEQGLATTFQQMLQLKTNVDHLRSDHAERLHRLSSDLYGGSSRDSMSTAIKRNALLEEIRSQPGLQYFLLPKPYNILQRAAQQGPVVILNSHEERCDGIIVLRESDPIHVPLPTVTLQLLKSQQTSLKELLGHCNVRLRDAAPSRLFGQREHFKSKTSNELFEELLSWLWKHVVRPVYHALNLHGIIDGRLWWLPTGGFMGLPLHASPHTDAFIHSYTATLGSLLEKSPRRNTHGFGLVGVTHTGPGQSHFFKGVGEEVKKITAIVTKTDFLCLEGNNATVNAVKSLLADYSWVHLACHGTQNLADPTKSCLLLYGGDLELEKILQMPLPNAEFVFLAACQTAMGNSVLVNESFHLGGGLIAAGFRAAVGTLWSMNDVDGPIVAESFYSYLFQDGRQPQATDTAEALHHAVNTLKANNVAYERWIPFIHMGV